MAATPPMPKAHRLLAAAILALLLAPTARAGQVTVTGEFTTFTPESVGTQSTLTATGPAGSTPTPIGGEVTSTLAAGTTQVDFKFTPSAAFLNNTFAFTAGPAAEVNVGDTFRLGSFTFTNGTWFDNIEIGFALTTHSETAALDGHVFTGTMDLVVNPNDPTNPYLSADYFFIEERPDLGSVRVFEPSIQPPGNPGNTGTVDLYARIGSLIPTAFENPSPGAFLSGSIGTDPQLPPSPSPRPCPCWPAASRAWSSRLAPRPGATRPPREPEHLDAGRRPTEGPGDRRPDAAGTAASGPPRHHQEVSVVPRPLSGLGQYRAEPGSRPESV